MARKIFFGHTFADFINLAPEIDTNQPFQALSITLFNPKSRFQLNDQDLTMADQQARDCSFSKLIKSS